MAVPLSYPEFRGKGIAIQAMILLAGILIMLYGGNSLTPAINAARDAGPESHERFQKLHKRSVRLNALVLLLGVGLLIAFANRPAPQTSGIEELSPGERGRFDVQLNDAIEQTEIKYGYRSGRTGQAGPAARSEPSLDPEMLKEIDSYYEQKKRRDLSRGRGAPAIDQKAPTPSPSGARDSAPVPESGN